MQDKRSEEQYKLKRSRIKDGSAKANESKKRKSVAKLNSDSAILRSSIYPDQFWNQKDQVYQHVCNYVNKVNAKNTSITNNKVVIHKLHPPKYTLYVNVIFNKARRVLCPNLNPKAVFSNKIEEDSKKDKSSSSKDDDSWDKDHDVLKERKESIDKWEDDISNRIKNFILALKTKDYVLYNVAKLIDEGNSICIAYDFKQVTMKSNIDTRNGMFKCQWTGKTLVEQEKVVLFKMITLSMKYELNEHYFYFSIPTNENTPRYEHLFSSIIEYRFLSSSRIIYSIMSWKKHKGSLGRHIEPIDLFNDFMSEKTNMTIRDMILDIVLLEEIFIHKIMPLVAN